MECGTGTIKFHNLRGHRFSFASIALMLFCYLVPVTETEI